MTGYYFLLIFFLLSCTPEYSEINFIKTDLESKSPKIIDIIGGSDEDLVKKVISALL